MWRIEELGYKFATGHAINDLAKGVFRRTHLFGEIPVDVSDILVTDTQTYPFKGLNLSQNLFLNDVIKTNEKFAKFRNPQPKL